MQPNFLSLTKDTQVRHSYGSLTDQKKKGKYKKNNNEKKMDKPGFEPGATPLRTGHSTELNYLPIILGLLNYLKNLPLAAFIFLANTMRDNRKKQQNIKVCPYTKGKKGDIHH